MRDDIFPQTDWSAVFRAAGQEPEKARSAFEQLCGAYRDSIVFWMRLQGLALHDAEDAAHDFLSQWLQRENPLKGFDKSERRFRDFLGVCLKNFLLDWHTRRQATRRGGHAEHVPIDCDETISSVIESPDAIDYVFALQIHRTSLNSVRVKWNVDIHPDVFERLASVALSESENPGYAALAKEFRVPVGTWKSWILRLRRKYHEAFRDEVSRQTDASFVDQDVLHLHNLLLYPPPSVQTGAGRLLQPPHEVFRLYQ